MNAAHREDADGQGSVSVAGTLPAVRGGLEQERMAAGSGSRARSPLESGAPPRACTSASSPWSGCSRSGLWSPGHSGSACTAHTGGQDRRPL